MSSRFVFCPIGSAGDVFPFVAVAHELQARGRDTLIIATENFRPTVEAAGVPFATAGGADEFEEIKRDPALWHPTRGLKCVMSLVGQTMRRHFALLEELVDPANDVFLLHALGFSARVHQDLHGTRGVTLHLAPSAYRSDFEQPSVRPGITLDRLPRVLKRAFWWLVDRAFLDRTILPELNSWRGELGLSPVDRVFKDWLHARDGTIALFPDWFGPPQPDWPVDERFAGFPAHDGENDLDAGLRDWLESGTAPIVFTPGSANIHGAAHARAAAGVAEKLERRVLFLAANAEGLPAERPEGLRHETWAPLGEVLARSAALVHHGGIGTTARGLAAGLPQLVVPMGFDQPDNATRLMKLGVGDWIKPERLSGASAAARLEGLLESAIIRDRARELAAREGYAGASRAAEILIDRYPGS